MKLILAVIAGIVALAVFTEANPAFGAQPQQKPGTCYRPRYRRSVEIADPESVDVDVDGDVIHSIEKRQVVVRPGYQGGNVKPILGSGWNDGGYQGGNLKPTPPPGFGNPGWGKPQCYRDYDCSGNKKCCSGACQTPSFVG